MHVCPSHISKIVQPIYFTLGECVAGDLRTCNVEFGAIWTHNTFNIDEL